MAGTRLIVQSSFLISITFLILFTLAFIYYQENNKWISHFTFRTSSNYPTQDFFLNRHGAHLLQQLQHDFSTMDMNTLKQEVAMVTFVLHMEEKRVKQLAQSLEDGINSLQTNKHNIVRVLTSTSPNEDKMQHHIFVSYHFQKSKAASMEMDTHGNIHLTLHHPNQNAVQLQTLFSATIAKVLHDQLFTHLHLPGKIPFQQSLACHTRITLLNENPSSYANTTNTAKDFHLQTSQIMTHALQQTLYPLYKSTLSPLCLNAPQVSTTTSLYGTLSQNSKLENDVYLATPLKLKTFWKDHSYQFDSTYTFFSPNNEDSATTKPHHLILYVPSSTKNPLYYYSTLQKTFASAFAIHDHDDDSPYAGAVSIVNFHKDESVEDGMLEAIYFLASHVRFMFGLPKIQPLLRAVVTEGEEETEVTFRHVPFFSNATTTPMMNENNGGGSIVVTEWEVNMLLRKSWVSKMEFAIQELQTLITFLLEVDDVPCTVEMAHEIQKASTLLNSALTKASTSSWKESTKDIHQTIQIIQTLQTHEEMMEPLGFLLEYYAAVFSPLLLPLIMPLIVGFVRELKRYKKLKAGEVWEVDDSDEEEEKKEK
mmetsp:Transcript_29120/g.38702  ORF Transcript_29120/g.38702 Transcript_29120/m.38702 type:complete len:594 (+) Transcript_29120:571-2352(+)